MNVYSGSAILAVYFGSAILAFRLHVTICHKTLSVFQAGFIKGKQTIEDIFVIQTTIERCLRFKRGHLYWFHVDFEKAFYSIQRGALWHKLRRKGIIDNMVKCIKEIYEGIKFCVKSEEEVTDFIHQKGGIRQGCSFSPYSFNIFIDDSILY
jgi:hypothetical protein